MNRCYQKTWQLGMIFMPIKLKGVGFECQLFLFMTRCKYFRSYCAQAARVMAAREEFRSEIIVMSYLQLSSDMNILQAPTRRQH